MVSACSEHACASRRIGTGAAQEAWRVEKKYSRYRDDSVIAWIHKNRGTTLGVDRWPVPESPRSITVAASSCTEAAIDRGHVARCWGTSVLDIDTSQLWA
jgi:hypothetical protein